MLSIYESLVLMISFSTLILTILALAYSFSRKE